MTMPDRKPMRTLALDTSTHRGSVALLDGPELAGELRIASLETHSARLLRSVDFLLGTVGWKLSDLDLIAAGIGPGSFTGIRIGLATALGLAQSLRLPFSGISGLDALALQVSFLGATVGVVLDAQRSQLYYSEYRCRDGKIHRIRQPELLYPADLERKLRRRHLYLLGDTSLGFFERLKNSRAVWPRMIAADLYLACGIGRLALARRRGWRSSEFLTAEPLYIRPPDAVKPTSSKG
jgi:tRNA threonylcarbamoyladenosine biosynthesis protein TsaB